MSNSRELNELTDLLKSVFELDKIKIKDNDNNDNANRVKLSFQYSKKDMPRCSIDDQTKILETGIKKAINFLNLHGQGDNVDINSYTLYFFGCVTRLKASMTIDARLCDSMITKLKSPIDLNQDQESRHPFQDQKKILTL